MPKFLNFAAAKLFVIVQIGFVVATYRIKLAPSKLSEGEDGHISSHLDIYTVVRKVDHIQSQQEPKALRVYHKAH